MHAIKNNIQDYNFVETFTLKQGLKKFGKKGHDAAHKEMKQLHDRVCFRPINPNNMTPSERKKAMESLIFLSEKRDGKIKARTCANGSVQRKWMDKDETASPTAALESVIMTSVIDAKEGRDVATVDIPNAFIQTEIPQEGERTILKIRGKLVDMLIAIDPGTYAPYVSYERGDKILYCNVLKAIYGMLVSALLFYKKWKNDLIAKGYKLNPYDPCVANKIIDGKQHTVTWHVDDLKISHEDPKVNDEFIKWVDELYGDDTIGRVTATRGKVHDYLGMILDYSTDGELVVDMKYYVKNMIKDFGLPINREYKNPASDNLFKVNNKCPTLHKEKAELFHTTVAKALFLSKRSRPDIQPTVAFLCTRVQKPTIEDWGKLLHLMGYLKQSQDEVLTLKIIDGNIIWWWIDVAFAVHPDMDSHTGAVMTMGEGTVQAILKKQKVNARSSTEGELIGVDDVIAQIIWTKKFLEAQGYEVKDNVAFEDNKSTMTLSQNGR